MAKNFSKLLTYHKPEIYEAQKIPIWIPPKIYTIYSIFKLQKKIKDKENLERINGRTKKTYLERNKNKNVRWLLGNHANKKVELNIYNDERKIKRNQSKILYPMIIFSKVKEK